MKIDISYPYPKNGIHIHYHKHYIWLTVLLCSIVEWSVEKSRHPTVEPNFSSALSLYDETNKSSSKRHHIIQ